MGAGASAGGDGQLLPPNKNPAAILTPVAHPIVMFENARLYTGGQVAENIDNVTVFGTPWTSSNPHMAS